MIGSLRKLHYLHWMALGASVAAFVVGLRWGTRAAGGSDSSCYLNQARLFSEFTTHIEQPLIDAAFWPRAEWTFTPAGHIPSRVQHDLIVPICPPGLPLVMTAARFVRVGELIVVPLCGALTVWLTFLLGQRLDDARTGAAAALLMLCSPIFLYQVVQPMTDVPAAAWWLLATLLAIGTDAPHRRPMASGLAAGVAMLTRPNLLPLAALIGAYLFIEDGTSENAALKGCATNDAAQGFARPVVAQGFSPAKQAQVSHRAKRMVAFVAGMVPAVVILALLQSRMYGSPIATGYGAAGDLFAISNANQNFWRYSSWLITTHTPVVLVGLAAPLVARSRGAVWLSLAMVIATFAAYLPYRVFDDWWYLRFLLPALPFLVVLAVMVVAALLRRILPSIAGPSLTAVTMALAVMWLTTASRRSAFELARFERHFIDAGTYAAERLPARAAVVTVLHSGSVHYYSQRPTLSWDTLPPDALDRTLAFLRSRGLVPVLMLDASEEHAFRERFERTSSSGRLDWPPAAQIGRTVRVYDPADRIRYFGGETIRTVEWPPPGPRR